LRVCPTCFLKMGLKTKVPTEEKGGEKQWVLLSKQGYMR
jgi:hypothetical protein